MQAAGAGAASVMQFLSSLLSQRGPEALPYSEDIKFLIRQHLMSLMEAFPSLVVRASQFVHNDGRAVRLLQADGTIPISYSGVTYNLPATIWLLETYPRSPPSVFLSPTRDMIVKPNHPLVDRSGHVSVPYLRSWVFPSSNLVDLVRSLSQLFSVDPPLYTRPPTQTGYHPPPPQIRPMPSTTPISYSVPAPTPSASRLTEDAAEVFRRNAVNKLIEKVHGDVVNLRRATEAEMESLFAAQAKMKRGEESLAMGLRTMQEEKEALEHQLQIVLMNADLLEVWVRENEGKKAVLVEGDFNVEDVFEPVDALSKQIIECTSSDMAVDDTIYTLDKALQEGMMSFEIYLKSVRALSREQFFHRAMSAKVKAVQMQMRVNNMAARVPQYAN